MKRRARHLNLFRAACASAALILAPGCATIEDLGIFHGQRVNLAESNYAAADMLVQQARGNFDPQQTFVLKALVNLYPHNVRAAGGAGRNQPPAPAVMSPDEAPAGGAAPRASSPAPFGQLVASQVGARLSQLGYRVAGSPHPGMKTAIVTGQYARANGRVLIALRMLDAATGTVLGAYDYSLPMTNEINDLMGTDENAFRLF